MILDLSNVSTVTIITPTTGTGTGTCTDLTRITIMHVATSIGPGRTLILETVGVIVKMPT